MLNTKKHTTKYLLALSTAALLASACNPQISGEEGNLGLTYDEGSVAGAGASSPLAVGAKLDYAGYPQEDKNQRVSFISATSGDDAIIRVDNVDGGVMTLEGVADGEAAIDVEAEGPGGAALADTFDLEAATVDSLEFDHPCAKDADAVYLVDHDVRLHYTMRAASKIAVGYGHYPVEFDPSDGATLGATSINGLLPLHTGLTTGEVTVSSTVDDTEFTLTLAEEGEIDGLKIFEQDFVNDQNFPASVGGELLLHVLPTISGLIPNLQEPAPVCQADIDVEVATTTPEICEVTYGPSNKESKNIFRLYETNVLTVSGKSEGTCDITIAIPGANDAAGLDESLSVEVTQSGDDEQDDGEPS
jgi:hypothetical protein